MARNLAPEGLSNAFEEAATIIRKAQRGTVGTLSWLESQIETVARLTRSKSWRKFYFVFTFYSQVAEKSLNAYVKRNFREKLLHSDPVSVPDPTDPNKTIEVNPRAQLRWISWAYGDLAEFFGPQSEDFYYKKVKEALVPDYVDEAAFPVFCDALIESYQDSSETLGKMILAMLESIQEKLEKSRDSEEITEELWEHYMRLYQDAAEWWPAAN